MLRRAGRYVWTDLGSSNSVDVTERVNVFRRYLRDLASLVSQANQHEQVGRVLEAFHRAANESATTPRMLCRQVLGSILQAVAHESWDFQQQVIKEVQFSMLSILQNPADALSQGMLSLQ
ncbi:HERC1, partial [Symbiodinium sp. KB8]